MATDNPTVPWQTSHIRSSPPINKTLDDLKMSTCDITAVWELQQELNTYMLQKLIIGNSEPQQVFPNIQHYFSVTRVTHTKQSKIPYLQAMDAIADSNDTIMQLLHDLHLKYIVDQNRQWLVVEGDHKVCEVLQSLKFEYGEELQWVIPYPGDWHVLKTIRSL